MAAPHLSFGTATDRISLLNPKGGFCLDGWDVGGTELDAVFQESQLADFRQMAAYRDITVFETFRLNLFGNSQDSVARDLQAMRAMIRLLADYWTTTWQTSVVYLAAQASCETNMRYAVAYDARLVGESNPFGQPFLQPAGGTVMDALTLIVERGPWLATMPGSAAGTCVEISSQGPSTDLYFLNFDGVDDNVNCGSAASVDNLPSGGNLTAEAWIHPDDWGENGVGQIFNKGNWYLGLNNLLGINAAAVHAVTTASTTTGLDAFMIDGQWHHITAVWTLASLRWDIAIDGVWSSDTVQAGAGAYSGDGASSLLIGNTSLGDGTFEGKMGWSRISDAIRYPVDIDFTPPERCTCPGDDADTVSLWCLTEGTGATAYDENANSNDGTITGATWSWDGCEKEYMEATCEAQSVFVANKYNVAQITHCYYWDNSAAQWTDGAAPPNNLIGDATPYAFLPAVPAVDDFVIFGVNTALADSGPFSSLVFDIGTAIGAGATLEWRYKATGDADDPGDGVNPWSALTVQDNTNAAGAMTGDPFDTTGIGSVHWEQPSDWETSNPNPGVALGVTGYWICCYVTAGPAANAPTQDNRDIYTITWPYIEFDEDEVGGDMPALLRLSVDSRSAQDGVGTTTDLWCQRIVAGLRSMDRGENFTAYINVSDEQNNPDITISLGGSMAAFATNTEAPTGISSTYTPGGAVAMATQVYIRLSPDWYGRFHAFVRGVQLTGNSGEVIVRLGYASADSAFPAVRHTTTRIFAGNADDQLLDFGEIVLGPAVDLFPLEVSHTYIEIEAEATAAATAIFYELILIPVDEWAIDAEDMLKNTGALGYTNDYWSHWECDGIRNQRNILSFLIGTQSGKIARYWRPITNGLPILQTGKHQRLWFLHARNDDYADVDDVHADSEICSTIQIWKQQRYTTLRGDQ